MPQDLIRRSRKNHRDLCSKAQASEANILAAKAIADSARSLVATRICVVLRDGCLDPRKYSGFGSRVMCCRLGLGLALLV